MVGGVIGHLPAQPAHQRICAGRPCVVQNVAFMRQAEMLDGVLHLVDRLGQHHRQKPEGHGGPALEIDRRCGDHQIAKNMKAGFTNDLCFQRLADIGLDDDATGAADKAVDAVVPVGETPEIEKVAFQRVGCAGQLAIALPLRGPAVVRLMHRHVIVTREHHRESDCAAEQLVQIAGLENCPVRQLVLRGIQEVHGDAEAEPGGDHPPASHGQVMQIAKHQDRTDMAA